MTREDGFEQLVDGEPITMMSNEIFKFKCCDCGLTHNMVIATEEQQEIGFVVEQVNDENSFRKKQLTALRNEIIRKLQLYTFAESHGGSKIVYVKDVREAIDSILFMDESITN